jgi:membrane associated rhomboid family serine protease
MSWQDRPYSQDDDHDGGFGGGGFRIAWPRPTSVVKWLLIINGAAYLLALLSTNIRGFSWTLFFGLSWDRFFSGYIWQPVTYMFSHSLRDPFHLIYNMLIVYFFGTQLEPRLGRQRFLQFYFACGLLAALAYLLLSAAVPASREVPVIGASGAVFGLIIAAMILFPHMQIIFIFVPMTVRVFGFIMLGIHFIPLLAAGNRTNIGGEVCHIAGALGGLALLYFWGFSTSRPSGGKSKMAAWMTKRRKGAWERRTREQRAEQQEVDRILAKVGSSGMHSLTRRERRTLEQATKRQQQREREFDRANR